MNNSLNKENLIYVEVQVKEDEQRKAIMQFLNKQKEDATKLLSRLSGYDVRAAKYVDNSEMRETIGIIIKTPEGRMTNVLNVERKKLFTSKAPLDFLFNYSFGFGKAEIDTIHELLIKNIDSLPIVNADTKMTLEDVYLSLHQYAVSHDGKFGITSKDGYLCIKTDMFKKYVTELDCGFSAKQIKQHFKELGLLKFNTNRTDFNVNDSEGHQYRTIAFKDLLSQGGEE